MLQNADTGKKLANTYHALNVKLRPKQGLFWARLGGKFPPQKKIQIPPPKKKFAEHKMHEEIYR